MYVEVTITAVADRDESCNLLTMKEAHTFAYPDSPTPAKIREMCKAHKDKFLEMWPHNQAKPVLIPLDVDICVKEGRRP